jgi:hypothetical protein
MEILDAGTRVRTRDVLLPEDRRRASPVHWDARRANGRGVVTGVIIGSSDAYWVLHPDGRLAPYSLPELEVLPPVDLEVRGDIVSVLAMDRSASLLWLRAYCKSREPKIHARSLRRLWVNTRNDTSDLTNIDVCDDAWAIENAWVDYHTISLLLRSDKHRQERSKVIPFRGQ